jgi:hypothetical protein
LPSRLVRFLFTVTSLAPLCFTYAVVFVLNDGFTLAVTANNVKGLLLVALMVALGVVCWKVLSFYSTKVPSQPMKITSLRVADRSAITFVVVYLLPLVTVQEIGIRPLVLFVVLGLLAWLVYHSDAYLVNPLLAMWPFKYHFYEVATDEEVTYILVSRREIQDTRASLEVRQISTYMFLDVEE